MISGSVAATTPLHQRPLAMCFDPNRDLAYTINSYKDTLSAVDPLTGLLLANVSVGRNPTALTVDTSSNIMYMLPIAAGGLTIFLQTRTFRTVVVACC